MKKLIFPIFAIIALAFLTSSCDDSKVMPNFSLMKIM